MPKILGYRGTMSLIGGGLRIFLMGETGLHGGRTMSDKPNKHTHTNTHSQTHTHTQNTHTNTHTCTYTRLFEY